MAIVSAAKHFRVILTGAVFRLFTDHKPLVQWLNRPPVNDRHARWLVTLQDMNFDIHYVEGKNNVLADLLSRPPGVEKSSFEALHKEVYVNAIALGVLSEKLREAQTDGFIESCKIEPEFHKVIDGYHFTDDSGEMRLLATPGFAEVVVKSIHNLGHFGRRRTYNTVKKNYFWPGMHTMVYSFVRSCQDCQKNKISRKMPRPCQSYV